MGMDGKYNWYTAIPERDRIVIDATAKWLRPVPWQLFVTLTFSWNVRGETADLKLKQWLNTVERELKARVCFVASKECKPPSFGMEVPWHFHVLVAAQVSIPKELREGTWRHLVCPGVRPHSSLGALTPDQAYFNRLRKRWQPKPKNRTST
jgi:hypothetical protein